MPDTIIGTLMQWHKVTIGFTSADRFTEAPQTFRDHRLDVTFTHHTSGETLVVPGYFAADGNAAVSGATAGTVWRVNFTPPSEGFWSYAASFRRGTDIAASTAPDAGRDVGFPDGGTGSFHVAATDKSGTDFRAKGMIHQLEDEDGSPSHQLWHRGDGDEFIRSRPGIAENFLAYPEIDNTGDGLHDPDAPGLRSRGGSHGWSGGDGFGILNAIAYLADRGQNTISLRTSAVAGDGRLMGPWATSHDQPLGKAGKGLRAHVFSTYDISKLSQWEIIFDRMDATGLYKTVLFHEGGTGRLLDEDTSATASALSVGRLVYMREMIARFGHCLAIEWALGGEDNGSRRERSDMAAWVRAVDPYRHVIAWDSDPGDGLDLFPDLRDAEVSAYGDRGAPVGDRAGGSAGLDEGSSDDGNGTDEMAGRASMWDHLTGGATDQSTGAASPADAPGATRSAPDTAREAEDPPARPAGRETPIMPGSHANGAFQRLQQMRDARALAGISDVVLDEAGIPDIGPRRASDQALRVLMVGNETGGVAQGTAGDLAQETFGSGGGSREPSGAESPPGSDAADATRQTATIADTIDDADAGDLSVQSFGDDDFDSIDFTPFDDLPAGALTARGDEDAARQSMPSPGPLRPVAGGVAWRDGTPIQIRNAYTGEVVLSGGNPDAPGEPDLTALALEAIYTHRSHVEPDGTQGAVLRPTCTAIAPHDTSLSATGIGSLAGRDPLQALAPEARKPVPVSVVGLPGDWAEVGDFGMLSRHLAVAATLSQSAVDDPAGFGDADAGMPESGEDIPDDLTAALLGLRVFSERQAPEGGIRADREAEAPDLHLSLQFAQAAALMAEALKPHDTALAAELEARAVRAFDWAEAQMSDHAEEIAASDGRGRIEEARREAAAELHELTGDRRYRDMVLDDAGPDATEQADQAVSCGLGTGPICRRDRKTEPATRATPQAGPERRSPSPAG